MLTTEIEDVEANVNFMGLGKTTLCAESRKLRTLCLIILNHNILNFYVFAFFTYLPLFPSVKEKSPSCLHKKQQKQ